MNTSTENATVLRDKLELLPVDVELSDKPGLEDTTGQGEIPKIPDSDVAFLSTYLPFQSPYTAPR